MATAAVQPEGTAANNCANGERIGFGVLLIGAPILMLGAAIFHPPHGIESRPESARRSSAVGFVGVKLLRAPNAAVSVGPV
jgi:hypothetical protein